MDLHLTTSQSKTTRTLPMHFHLFLSTFFWLLILNATALSIIQNGLLAYDTPVCSVFCGGKAARKVGVSYLDGRGNCLRPDYHSEWQNCLQKACTDRDRRKVLFSFSN